MPMLNQVDNIKELLPIEGTLLTEDELNAKDDIFCDFLDTVFTRNLSIDFQEFDDTFQLENFFPAFVGKGVEGGKWVRIKTEIGYNLHYAKPSSKRLSGETLDRKRERLGKKLDSKYYESNHTKKLELLSEIKKTTNEMRIVEFLKAMPTELKFVKIQVGKSKYDYLLPYQYEVIENIEDYMEAVTDPRIKESVKYKGFFTKDDEEQVFYLQSRGISKDTATMMCKLQHCYFIVNVQALFREWMQPVKENGNL